MGGPERTGRTTRMLLTALLAASEGKKMRSVRQQHEARPGASRVGAKYGLACGAQVARPDVQA